MLLNLIQETIDPHFGLIRYAESLCIHLPEFEPLETELSKPLPFTQQLCIDIFSKKIEELNPEFVGFTVPFPGNLLSALRCAQWIKQNRPDIKTVMGGGFVNTDLGIELIETLFKKENIRKIFELAGEQKLSKRLRIIQSNADFYIHNAEPVIAFLSGRDRAYSSPPS